MTVGSLFAGIGGFDLGFERAGFEIKWQVEIDDYCSRVLAKHWPAVRRYGDIRAIDWATVEPVDVICGGFPCQPHSLAGRRLAGADDRDLWPEYRRCVRALRPRWVVGENVSGILSSDAGRFFGGILRDLAESGYGVEWDCIPASAVGAPHQRDRVWIIAHAGGQQHEGASLANERPPAAGLPEGDSDADGWRQQERAELDRTPEQDSADRHPRRRHPDGLRDDLADANGSRLAERVMLGGVRSSAEVAHQGPEFTNDGEMANPASWRRERRRLFTATTDKGRSLGLSQGSNERGGGQWLSEPDVGRVAHGVPARVDRLRGLGNAVVPQIPEWIAHRIKEADGNQVTTQPLGVNRGSAAP